MDDPNNNNGGDGDEGSDHLKAAADFLSGGDKGEGGDAGDKGAKGAGDDKGAKGAGDDKGEAKKPSLFNPIKAKEAGDASKGSVGDGEEGDPDLDKLAAPGEKSAHRPDWDKMKSLAAERGKRIKELEKLAAEGGSKKADEASAARIKELEAKIQDYDSKLKAHDLKSHPEFQQKFVVPRQNAIDEIKQALELEGHEADVDKVLALEGKAFVTAVSEILGNLSEFNKLTVDHAFRTAKKLSVEESKALANVDQLREQYKEQFSARARQSFDQVTANYQDSLAELAVPDDSPEEDKQAAQAYNDALSKVTKKAEALAFGSINETQAADMAHKAARFEFLVEHAIPHLTKVAEAEITKRDGEIASLQKKIKDLTDANPGYDGHGSDNGGDAGDNKSEGEMSHLDAAKKYVS